MMPDPLPAKFRNPEFMRQLQRKAKAKGIPLDELIPRQFRGNDLTPFLHVDSEHHHWITLGGYRPYLTKLEKFLSDNPDIVERLPDDDYLFILRECAGIIALHDPHNTPDIDDMDQDPPSDGVDQDSPKEGDIVSSSENLPSPGLPNLGDPYPGNDDELPSPDDNDNE